VSLRGVQAVIGKLMTDEAFRQRFEERGGDCLAGLGERGVHLDQMEIAALVETDPRLWSRMAKLVGPRLQRLGVTSEHEDQTPHKQLTRREQQVLCDVADGLTNKEIAARVGVSEGAVKATLQQLFRKTHVRTRARLVRIAIEDELVFRQTPNDCLAHTARWTKRATGTRT
jgi:DNA-binding CsgD family transcriptional regulator